MYNLSNIYDLVGCYNVDKCVDKWVRGVDKWDRGIM